MRQRKLRIDASQVGVVEYFEVCPPRLTAEGSPRIATFRYLGNPTE